MKTFTFFLSLLVIQIFTFGQTPQTITMDNNKLSIKDVKPELQYIFPDFQNGSVILKNHPEVKCKLNYNFLLDEVLFIDETGKKMAIANPQDVLQVYIADRLFIPASKGYFEVIEKGTVSLVYKWTCNIVEKGKEGAMGISSDAPSIYQMNRMSFDAREWKLDVDKEAVIAVEVVPYLKIRSKYIQVKGARDFLKAFPGNSSRIKDYIEQKPVDFKKEADLRRLTKYCNSL
jgi:hypothetical protein